MAIAADTTHLAAPRRVLSPGCRIYAIGDTHGMVEALERLHAKIVADAASREPMRNLLVYLGDYVDRGPDSRAVIETLVAPPPAGFMRICLKGNHEDIMLRFLEDESEGPSWFANGGITTLAAYGVRSPLFGAKGNDMKRAQRELAERLPKAHLDFLRNLQISHSDGDYFFVHAGLRPGVKLDAQSSNDMMWIRDEFLDSNEEFGKLVVHGHTIVAEPQIRANRIGIDSVAFATGRLTCLVLEGTERRFLTS